MLGVPAATLNRHGAVSAQTAAAMAKGALKNSQADIAVAITGIAGPGGGSKRKPVGLVYFAAASRDGKRLARSRRFGKIGRSGCGYVRSRRRSSFSRRWPRPRRIEHRGGYGCQTPSRMRRPVSVAAEAGRRLANDRAANVRNDRRSHAPVAHVRSNGQSRAKAE